MEHHLFIFRLEFIHQTRPGLRNIETVALSGKGIHVVQKRVAVFDLNCLANANAQNAGRIDALALIDDDRLSRDRRLREISLQPHERIREAAVDRRYDVFLDHSLAGIHLGAHRIHAHSDDGIAWQLPCQPYVAFDRAGVALDNSSSGFSRAGREQTKE